MPDVAYRLSESDPKCVLPRALDRLSHASETIDVQIIRACLKWVALRLRLLLDCFAEADTDSFANVAGVVDVALEYVADKPTNALVLDNVGKQVTLPLDVG